MRVSPLLVAALLFSSLPAAASSQAPTDKSACCGPISAQGAKLIALIDSMHVERLWLAREHVDWRTGEPDRPVSFEGPGRATHCSAFAAAVGQRAGVYLLRPPQHSQIFLASAQTAWLRQPAGASQGWKTLDDPDRESQAQSLANQGDLVVIAFESPDPHRPGHIVIVRPSTKSVAQLEKEGPEVAEAGTSNYTDTIASTSFTHHPGAWPDGVRYYWHSVDWSNLAP